MGRFDEIWELTRTRVALFLREPEILFWTFMFPLILAAVLGFAFRNSGPEANRVGLLGTTVAGAGSAAIWSLTRPP